MPTKLAIRLCDSRPNSGSIAISVAVVIEPMRDYFAENDTAENGI